MNIFAKLINLGVLAIKQATRNRTRSFLTFVGVSTGMFLFTTIETMQDVLQQATVTNAKDTTLVVYRENRFCPSTSRLPEHYKQEISRIDGVKSVTPVQIVVNNCGTSLDVVVFRGVPPDYFKDQSEGVNILQGSINDWLYREDAAIVGKNLAIRRNLSIGDRFDAAGITVEVAAIAEAKENTQNDNVAFVHLSFLQQASRIGLGVVTQFNVKVFDSRKLKEVAASIDAKFQADIEPTSTKPEKTFFANTALDLIELIHFSRWVGLASVIAVFALIANTTLLTVRGKISEHAILKTLGFSKCWIGWIIIAESIFLSFLGGIFGIFSAFCFFYLERISIGNEGLVLAFVPSSHVLFIGGIASIMLGLLAGVYPAWQAGNYQISESLKTTS